MAESTFNRFAEVEGIFAKNFVNSLKTICVVNKNEFFELNKTCNYAHKSYHIY